MRTLCTSIFCLIIAALGFQRSAAHDFDISVEEVLSPGNLSEVQAGYEVALEALILNNGPSDAAFVIVDIHVEDSDGNIVHGPETLLIGALAEGESADISATPWTPNQLGEHTVVVTSTLSDLDPGNNQLTSTVEVYEVLINKESAIETVTDDLITPNPIAATLVAFLHNYGETTTWLPVGTVVTDHEGTVNRTLDAKTYFFWFDNEQEADWYHPTSFILFNAWNGQYEVIEAESWPLIDGAEIPSFFEADNSTVDQFYGTYSTGHDETVNYTPVDQPVNTTWAMIVTGEPGSKNKAGEKKARKNDVNRIKNYLNNNPRGPQIADKNIKVLTGGDDMEGATKQEICDSLDALKDCDKLYFFYGGHGSRGGSAILKGSDMKWKELACKLIENGAKEVCVCIEACYSGSAEKPMQEKSIPGPGGTEQTLNGELVYSSSKGRTTLRINKCGTPFYKGLEACSQSDSADVNKDKKISVKEAILWAANRDSLVSVKQPGWTDLDNESRVTVTRKKRSGNMRLKNTGDNITYYLCRTCYLTYEEVPKQGGGTTTKKTPSWFTRVYATSNNPRKKGTTVDIICDGTKIGEFDGELQRHEVKCIGAGPANWKKFHLKKTVPGIKQGGSDRTTALYPDESVFTLYTTTYLPGEFLYYSNPVDEEPNHTIDISVNPAPGWNLGVNPTTLTTSVLINPEYYSLSGTVPTTATTGTSIYSEAIDADDGSGTYYFVDALIQSTINSNIVDGDDIVFNEIDLYGSILSTTGVIDITDGSIHLMQSGAVDVAGGGTLNFSNGIIEPYLGVTYDAAAAGTLNWMASALIRPNDGLELNGAAGFVKGGGIHDSQGDGLKLSGNMAGMTIDGIHVTGAADDGIFVDGTYFYTIKGADIENSGDDDIELSNGAFILMLNSEYDSNKENVPAGSLLGRLWTTSFNIINQDGEPLTNATVNVYDATATMVAALTADAEGYTNSVDLVEYGNIGGTTAWYTPHYVEVIYNNSTTLTVHTADSPDLVEILFPTPLITDVKEPQPSQRPAGPPLNISPNPADKVAAIAFRSDAAFNGSLRVVDVRGRETAHVFKGRIPAGDQLFRWNCGAAAAGTYFVLLESDHFASVARIVIQR